MNGYRIVADWSHVLATILLLTRLLWKQNAKGISGKSQLLYSLTYLMRYTDLWIALSFISVYNTTLKIFFIGISFTLVWLIYMTHHSTHDTHNDAFRIEYLIFPVTILALFLNYQYTLIEVCWTWSIYMEAVALIPQFYMIWKGGQIDSHMVLYIFLMALYRGMYIFNWVYRYYNEHFYDTISIVAGVVETTVAALGLVGVIALYLRKGTLCRGSQEQTIYTLPAVEQQFQKDHKFLSFPRVDIVKSPEMDTEHLIQP